MQRLKYFLVKNSVKICGENAGFGGNCITEQDVVNLWRLHIEASIPIINFVTIIMYFYCQHKFFVLDHEPFSLGS